MLCTCELRSCLLIVQMTSKTCQLVSAHVGTEPPIPWQGPPSDLSQQNKKVTQLSLLSFFILYIKILSTKSWREVPTSPALMSIPDQLVTKISMTNIYLLPEEVKSFLPCFSPRQKGSEMCMPVKNKALLSDCCLLGHQCAYLYKM